MSSASRSNLIRLIGLISLVGVLTTAACGTPPPSGGATAPAPVTPIVNPYARNRAAMAEGRQLFVRFNCSGCHGGRAGGGMGPSLRDVDWIYGQNDAHIYSSISDGRAHGMPAWQPRLTSDQIWKLVTYIQSLRTRNEPNPPSG